MCYASRLHISSSVQTAPVWWGPVVRYIAVSGDLRSTRNWYQAKASASKVLTCLWFFFSLHGSPSIVILREKRENHFDNIWQIIHHNHDWDSAMGIGAFKGMKLYKLQIEKCNKWFLYIHLVIWLLRFYLYFVSTFLAF
jgi:hypothetical protein